MHMYLPRVSPKPSLVDEPAPSSAGGDETILICEDEALVRDLLREMLVRAGYTVLVAEDGLEALEIAQSHPEAIDLLLTDLVMPNLNGKQLADQMKEGRPETKVLFLSGYADDVIPGEMPADIELLPKPFSTTTLLNTVRRTLDRS